MKGDQTRSQKPAKKAAPPAPEPAQNKPRKPRARVALQRKADSVRDCVYCKDVIGEAGHAWCPRCKTVVHKDCADELAGCPSLGCRGELLRYTPKALGPPRQAPVRLFPALAAAAFYVLSALAILFFGYVLAALFTLGPAVLAVVGLLWLLAGPLVESLRVAWLATRARRPLARLRLGLKSPKFAAFGRSALRVSLAVMVFLAVYFIMLMLAGSSPNALMAGLNPR